VGHDDPPGLAVDGGARTLGLGSAQVARDIRHDARNSGSLAAFTIAGFDDHAPVIGRGRQQADDRGRLTGRRCFHLGGDADLVCDRW
jgi:hypothetical protein